MARVTAIPPSTFGIPALRTEDPRFLRGEGRYVDNVDIPGALRAVFVRSIFAHATVDSIEGLAEARAMPGVAAVFAAGDLDLPAQLAAGSVEVPGGDLERPFERPILAGERVRYVGEPVAVVLADTLAHAQDAAETIWLDVTTLPVVTDAEAAAADDADLLFPETGTNVATRFDQRWDDDVLAGSDVVVRGRFVNQRLAPVPMEMNGIAVVPEADGTFTVWVSSQAPFDVRDEVAEIVGVDRRKVRAIAPDVGGGFGAKIPIYPEFVVVAKAAAEMGRPVRWAESRTESMLSMTHGRAQVQWIELGARRDGSIVGARLELLGDVGAYPQLGSFMGQTTAEMISGVYAIPEIAFRGRAVVTNRSSAPHWSGTMGWSRTTRKPGSTSDGRAWSGMVAIIRIGARLGGPGRLLEIVRLFPRSAREWLYRRVAHNRYRFGRTDMCELAGPGLRARLLKSGNIP